MIILTRLEMNKIIFGILLKIDLVLPLKLRFYTTFK